MIEQIYLEIFWTEFCPDSLGKVKVRVYIYVSPVSTEWLPIFPFSWKYCFFDDFFKETATRKFYEYCTDRLVAGSIPQIDAEGRDLHKSIFFTF